MGKLKSGEVRDFQIWTIPTGLPEILPRAYGQRGAAPAGLGAVYCGRRARSEGPAGGVGWVCPIAPKGAPRAPQQLWGSAHAAPAHRGQAATISQAQGRGWEA